MRFGYMLLVAALLLGMVLGACSVNSVREESREILWTLFISPKDPWAGDGWQNLVLSWNGEENDYPDPDSVYIQFGDRSYWLENWGSHWFGRANLTPGMNYEFWIVADGILLTHASLQTVMEARADFPADFSPHSEATLFWDLEGDNQGQVLRLSAENEEGTRDEYVLALYPGERGFTIPANAVRDLGWQASYSLELTQMNQLISNRVLIQSSQTLGCNYPLE